MFARLKELRPPVRALLALFWIYTFTTGLSGAFTQIFLYERFSSIELNVIATMIAYTGIMTGFCIPGFFASVWRLNIKSGFVWSFVVNAAAIISLLYAKGSLETYTAMFFWGAGQGAFWLTVNTFELSETEDAERDFYSSVLSAGNQILSLVAPAVATLLIYLSESVFHIGTFTLLFTAAPAVYLFGFFCFHAIEDYRPEPLRWADVTHFFADRRNQFAQIYTLGMGFQQFFGTTAPQLVVFLILGTALKVGVYDTLFAIFSALCVLGVARYRTPSNRLFLYGATTLGLALITAWLGYEFALAALVVYTLVEGVLQPLNSVSSHVMDLSSMEIGRGGADFYATMLLRDFFLWVWRMAGGLVFLALLLVLPNEHAYLSAGMYLLAGGLLVTYIGAYFFTRAASTRG